MNIFVDHLIFIINARKMNENHGALVRSLDSAECVQKNSVKRRRSLHSMDPGGIEPPTSTMRMWRSAN